MTTSGHNSKIELLKITDYVNLIVYEGVNDPTEFTSGHFGNFLGDNRNNYPKPVGQIISQIHPGYSVCLNQGTRIQNSISILNIFNRQ